MRSVWMVVDLESGDADVASPEKKRLRRRPLPASALRGRGNGPSASLLQDMTSAVVWFVRPGVGAWVGVIDDGSPQDEDRTVNGRVTAMLKSLIPLGDSPETPDDTKRDDVIAIVDPVELDILDVRVKGN
jgi:hypothetical protein